MDIHRLDDIKLSILIRSVEEKFLSLFEEGNLNGTVHTCIGQELSAVSICKNLKIDDFVFSNHRCHGHYIAFAKEYKSLISELMGKKSGVCAGIGGSQHLCNKNFFSNGPQGSLAPVSVGVAQAIKFSNKSNIVATFIGDGTFGEGILYESLNLAALYNLPVLFICENNLYAQSTPITNNLSGSIIDRVSSFGIKSFESSTWDIADLKNKSKEILNYVRLGNPGFLKVNTYRLKAHSKGDDDRDKKEVDNYLKKDLIFQMINSDAELKDFYDEINLEINEYVDFIKEEKEIDYETYRKVDQKLYINDEKCEYLSYNPISSERQVKQINQFFKSEIKNNKKTILIGEDIADPYGGAFKVTKGISSKYPDNLISTPISEAGIVGMGIGLSLLGYKPYVEIMFGDFITYAFDQIVSNASKFHHMYNKQVSVPLTIRMPMGGGRGYGPTHSQSIEKFFIGVNNITIVALNSLVDAKKIYQEINKDNHTNIVIENKIDYGRLSVDMPKTIDYDFKICNLKYPIIVGSPKSINDKISIITFGGALHHVLGSVDKIFYEFECLPKVIVLTKIYPLQSDIIKETISGDEIIITVEEGNIEGGFGSEIISSILEDKSMNKIKFCRIGSENVPIPSPKKLEDRSLLNTTMIIDKLREII